MVAILNIDTNAGLDEMGRDELDEELKAEPHTQAAMLSGQRAVLESMFFGWLQQ